MAVDPAGAESPSQAPSSPEASGPSCEDIWSVGATIPRSYDGCVQDGTYVKQESLSCSSGQRLVTFEDHFYGVMGGEVRVSDEPLKDDRGYVAAVRSCSA